MKILYVHQYFKTPQEGGSIRSYYLAKGLVDAGHEVTMITAHSSKKAIKNIDGINVHYLPVAYDNSFGFARRVFAFFKFVWLAKRESKRLGSHDLAYVMTTPLTTGFIAMFLKHKLEMPYYFEVGDLWPEAPIKMNVIRNYWIKKWLYSLERRFYFHAEKIIALSPDIRNYIERVSPGTKVYVIPNMSDCSFFEPSYSIGDFSAQNKFQITYCGAIGKANHLEFFISAARQCEIDNVPVDFHVIGEGSERKRLQKEAIALRNITFHKHASKEKVKQLLAISDAVYISFKDVEVLGTGSPNKFFDSLAAGKLSIINFPGWISSIVDKNKIGFSYDPNRPVEFVRKLKVFINSPQLLRQYQKNGRKLGELYYSKDLQCRKLLKILNNEYKLERNDSEVFILTA